MATTTGSAERSPLHWSVWVLVSATYVEHRRRHHPGEPVMNREQFFRDCQERRYAGGRGIRCS
jgi:uncharacterized short protein YbdD (DUF466 family)